MQKKYFEAMFLRMMNYFTKYVTEHQSSVGQFITEKTQGG